MARPASGAAQSVERFFQFSLLALLTCGFLAVAGSGALDAPTLVLTSAGLLLRGLVVAGALRFEIPDRAATGLTLAYIAFFAADYFLLSQSLLDATVHLVFFLAVLKLLTGRTRRDFLYTAILGFLELLAGAILSVSLSFFVFLALFLLASVAAFTSGEIRASLESSEWPARAPVRRFPARLAALTAFTAIGIMLMTSGLFFLLPRTADMALRRFVANRFVLPGFSREVQLGQIGEVKTSSRAVMHIRADRDAPAGLKWRGDALAAFDGRRWFNPPEPDRPVPVERGLAVLASDDQRRRIGSRTVFRIDWNLVDSDALFVTGSPEFLWMPQRRILRTAGGGYRLTSLPPDAFRYEISTFLENGQTAPPPAAPLSAAERERFLQLPARVDARIAALAREAAGGGDDAARARALERHLRTRYGYTLELPSSPSEDPMAHFLFERRKGHCEYFASAMAVMLRTQGIPSRLVNGFQNGARNPVSGLYVVRASDAHSWVEAWLPGRGWVTFDPTPPDPSPPGFALFTQMAFYLDAAETFWNEWVLTYDLSRQAELAGEAVQRSRRFRLRWFEQAAGAMSQFRGTAAGAMRRWGAPALVALLLVVGAVLAGPRLLRAARVVAGKRRVRAGRAALGDATLLYLRLLDALRRHGYEKPAWVTPHEFAATIRDPALASCVDRFTVAYNAVRFGGHPEDAARMPELLEAVERQDART